MNRLKISQIIQACVMGIIAGIGIGIWWYSTIDYGDWRPAIANGVPFGFGTMIFSLIKSYNLGRWNLGALVIGLVIWIGIRICLYQFLLGRLF
jgi:hypothetical protein